MRVPTRLLKGGPRRPLPPRALPPAARFKGLIIAPIVMIALIALYYQFLWNQQQHVKMLERQQERIREREVQERTARLRRLDHEGRDWGELVPPRLVETAQRPSREQRTEAEPLPCLHCQQTGTVQKKTDPQATTFCPVCLGVGYHHIRRIDEKDAICHVCGGMGRIYDEETDSAHYCRRCDGRGLLRPP